MPFSLSSYVFGVGTIVGALAFGVGTGVFMSKSALNTTAAAPSRVERVARSEPAPAAAPQVAEPTENSKEASKEIPKEIPKETPAPRVDPAPAVVATPAPHPAPAVQPATPTADTRSQTAEKQPAPAKQGGSANQPERSTNQPEQVADQPEQREAVQEKPAERRVQRSRHYAERRMRRAPVVVTRPLQSDEQDQPEDRPEVVYRREQPRGFFQIFSPPADDYDAR
jgi:hypothetical protein